MIKKIIFFSIGVITLYSVDSYSKFAINNTTIWWALLISILILFYMGKSRYFSARNEDNITFVKLYLFWNVVCIVRGLFVAQGYWEWKFLIQTSLVLLLPFCVYVVTNTFLVQKIVQQWFRYMLPAFFVFYLFISAEAVGHYLIPVSFILLFFPFLNTKWRIITICMALVVFSANLGARSNVIKFIVPMALAMTYYFTFTFSKKVFKIARTVFIILPIILLYLGITNIFNVFKMSEYIEGDYKFQKEDAAGGQEDLTSDTRTFLYEEVINSALKYNYVWLGRTPARGNESPSFGPEIDKDLGTHKMERHSNEVSILNVFTWTGIVGVILYFLIFFKATYLAIYKSKSRIMKIIGLYLSFRWAYTWVEDFSMFNLSYFFLWVVIGMCLSQDFREMSDQEFKNWVRGIFDERYRKAIVKKQLVTLKEI